MKNIQFLILTGFMAGILFFSSCVDDPDDLIPFSGTDKWINITTKNGLSGDLVYSIMEDLKGNMWFGTNNGATRLSESGVYTKFTPENGISGLKVFTIEKTPDGWIFFGTDKGLTIFVDDVFTNIEKIGDESWEITRILADSRGTIWFANNVYGLLYFSSGKYSQLDFGDCYSCYLVNTLFEDSKKNIWIGSSGGAIKYDYQTLRFFNTSDGLSVNDIQSIGEDRWGDIWFGPYGGLNVGRYDGRTIQKTNLFSENPKIYVMDIASDRSGNLWFGMNADGAFKFNGSTMRKYLPKDGLNASSVNDILVDSEGNIWFGTINKGVFKYVPGL